MGTRILLCFLVSQYVCGRGWGFLSGWQLIGSPYFWPPPHPPLQEDGPAAWLNYSLPSTGRCPKPLKNRDVITLRSWLPMGADYIIMNYSVKHPVSWPALPLGVQKGDGQGWAVGVQ